MSREWLGVPELRRAKAARDPNKLYRGRNRAQPVDDQSCGIVVKFCREGKVSSMKQGWGKQAGSSGLGALALRGLCFCSRAIREDLLNKGKRVGEGASQGHLPGCNS